MQRIDNYYNATLNNPKSWPHLDGDLSVDVAIVGAGITGVATTLELAERGYKVALLEAHQIGWGATGRNGGQVTGSLSGDNAMLKQLRHRYGTDAEQFVWQLRWRGHDIITERIARYNINCDLKTGHLLTAWTEKDMPMLELMVQEAHRRGMAGEVSLLNRDETHQRLQTPLYFGAVHNKKNLHLHSLKLCIGEAIAAESQGASIFENTNVVSIDSLANKKVAVKTQKGTVTAANVVIAGNAHHRLMRRQLGGYLFPAVLGNLVTAPLGSTLCNEINRDDDAVYDSRMVLDYYRITGDGRLMFGGGTNYSGRDINEVGATLRPALERTFPVLKDVQIDYAWTGTAGIIINRIPMLGRIKDNIFYAQGYSGHGMATSHILAEVTATAIAGNFEQFDTFQHFSHWRIPVPATAGSSLVALGMAYYLMLEKLHRRM